MILSRYRNSPYRTPTPTNSLSPPSGPSPKRKRADAASEAATTTPAPRSDTQHASMDMPQTGVDSPRTKVAAKFVDLDLHRSPQERRKRLKWNQHLEEATIADSFDADASDMSSAPEASSQDSAQDSDEIRLSEMGEAPNHRLLSSPPPPHNDNHSALTNRAPSPDVVIEKRRNQLLSPPPPSRDAVVDRSVSPVPMSEDLSSDQAALTWQEDEITGHEIDPTLPDDDGEGINGIGFKPTAAMAYARSQTRKQQVSDWKAREAKEARQKRFERRRGTGIEAMSGKAGKRTVRFSAIG